MKRTNVVKLVVDKNIHEKLKELAVVTAKCWNEVNWLRMQQFKKGRRVDFTRAEKEVYEKYKQVLKVNAQQVTRKNAEDWRSFFSLVKEKKEGKLPKWFKPRPPGYWKDKSGKYKLMIVIRNDHYEVDEENRIIYLKDFKLALRAFSNKLFGQTSSIVLANIATWVLSTHVAIRGRAYLFRLIRPIIIPNTPI